MVADVGHQVLGAGLGGVHAGHPEGGDTVLDPGLLELLGLLVALVDGPFDGPFDQEDLLGVRPVQVFGGVQDADGAPLASSVPGVGGGVGDRGGLPGQGVQPGVDLGGVPFGDHHVVGVQFLHDEPGGRTVGVSGVLGQDPAGQVGGGGDLPQEGLVGRYFVRLGADGSFTDHDGVDVGGHRDLEGDLLVVPDRATQRLAVSGQTVA